MKKILRKILPTSIKVPIRITLDQVSLLPRRLSYITGNVLPKNYRILTTNGKHTFFGYYDITPFNKDGTIILATQSTAGIESPHDKNLTLDIGYFNIEKQKPEFTKLSQTKTWNWQQGCRVQWILHKGEEHIIYNDFLNGQYKSVIYSLNKKQIIKTLDFPIYSISKDGKSAISINFSRLHHFRRGYGYSNNAAENSNLLAPENDGIWLINIENNTHNLIVNYKNIITHKPIDGFQNSAHYFNHLSFNPSASKFLFFHLWSNSKSNSKSSRLMVADKNGKNIRSYAHNIRASHYCWLDDKNILLTGLNEEKVFGYYKINIEDSTVSQYGHEVLCEDGHPTILEDDLLLTDTYPNSRGYQNLFTYNRKTNRINTLGKFYSPISYQKELRCDLHPRVMHDNKLACVDMVYKNKRAMCILPITKDDH